MTIRTLKKEDIQTVASYENEISVISFGDEAINDIDFYIKKLTKSLAMKDSYMYVAEQDQAVVGWLWFAKRSNFITNDPYIDFRSFYIAEEYRSKGVSELLMDKLMEVTDKEGINKIIGRVESNNLFMRFLYKKYDFVPKHITMEYNKK